MRVLRQVRILLGLAVVIGVGVALARFGVEARQESTLLEWSNALVSKTLNAPYTPNFRDQVVREGSEPDIWVVSGQMTFFDNSDGETRSQYEAVVRQLCKARRERKCWALKKLTFGEQAAPGSVMYPPVTLPIIEPTYDISSTAENGSLDGIKSSAPDVEEPGGSERNLLGESRPQSNETVGPARPDTGVADSNTWSAALLNEEVNAAGAAEVNANIGHGVDQTIYLIQDRLNQMGYAERSSLSLDGLFGPRTREAILVYQQAHGLPVDGQPSGELFSHMERLSSTPTQVAKLSRSAGGSHAKTLPAGQYQVRLGIFRSSIAGLALWQRLQGRHGDLLDGLTHSFSQIDGGEAGPLHFLYAGPLPDASSARSLCRSLIERNVDCLAA